MGGDFIGHRPPGRGSWKWLRGEFARLAGRRHVPRAVAAVGLVVVAAGLSLGLFFALRSDGSGPMAARIASPTPASPIASTPELSPTPTPRSSAARFRLAVWEGTHSDWQFGDLQLEASGDREGRSIPFLLRIDYAAPGSAYRVALRYTCQIDGAAAFDFLTGYERDAGSGPALAGQGPGRSQADATIPVPDDPSIAFDDEEQEGARFFHLWGASFGAELTGSALVSPCRNDKLMVLNIRAQAETVFLLWGGHLASAEDWGGNRGAVTSDRPFGMNVVIPGMWPESQSINIVPAGDGATVAEDDCPSAPNSDQTDAAGDEDCDGFTTTDESAIGTDPLVACGAGAWPPDITDSQAVDFLDLNAIVPLLFQPAAGNERFNLSVDGNIDFFDLNAIVPLLFQSCSLS